MMSYSFVDLLKLSKKILSGNEEVRLAILADSATQHLKTAIKGYGIVENVNINIFEADYDQIQLQVYNDSSELYKFNPGFIIIFMCVQKLYEKYCICKQKTKFAEEMLKQIETYHDKLFKNINGIIIQTMFLEEDDRVFGNFGLKLENSFIYQVKNLNLGLMKSGAVRKNLFFLDLNHLRSRMENHNPFCDLVQYCNSKQAISLHALPRFSYEIIRTIKAVQGKVKKCIVLDLDNTLWGGVIGEDELNGIELGELGIGYAFYDFQLWLKELKNRGILLCVCSKNDEHVAKEPFEHHDDMVLDLNDITVFVANWEDKASNIKHIQELLNIGMDSMVFIDDNPFERELVRKRLPEVTVPELPEDPVCYRSYLEDLNLFETISFSVNDKQRTEQYRLESKRKAEEKDFEQFDDYLKSLAMTAKVDVFEKYYFPRIAQLTQRSNQFNLRTVRYTEGDIEKISSNPNYVTLYFTLKDKFGDYGLVSVVIMKKCAPMILFIDTWVMSCRVLKRGMEQFISNVLIDWAKKQGFKKIIGEYVRTSKNKIVEGLYQSLGYHNIKDDLYEIEVGKYKDKEHFIKLNGED